MGTKDKIKEKPLIRLEKYIEIIRGFLFLIKGLEKQKDFWGHFVKNVKEDNKPLRKDSLLLGYVLLLLYQRGRQINLHLVLNDQDLVCRQQNHKQCNSFHRSFLQKKNVDEIKNLHKKLG